MKQYDLISFGSVYADINCIAFPHQGSLMEATETVGGGYEFQVGGSASISVLQAASLGLKSAFLGKVGPDHAKTIISSLFAKSGCMARLLESKYAQSNISINYINPQGRTIMTTVGDANQSLTRDDIKKHLFPLVKKAHWLYLGSVLKLTHLLDAYSQLVTHAKKHNTSIFIDHGRVTNNASSKDITNIKELTRAADVYTPSIDEARIIWGDHSQEDLAHTIKSANPHQTVVITNSTAGTYGINHRGITAHTKANDIIVKNTVGAGDCFNAALIAAVINQVDFPSALQYAQKVAEHKISTNRYATSKEVS